MTDRSTSERDSKLLVWYRDSHFDSPDLFLYEQSHPTATPSLRYQEKSNSGEVTVFCQMGPSTGAGVEVSAFQSFQTGDAAGIEVLCRSPTLQQMLYINK